MKVRQASTGKIVTNEIKLSGKRNSGIKQVSGPGKKFKSGKDTKKTPVRIKAGDKVRDREITEQYSPKMFKTCNALEAVCFKINKLEKEKQKLINIILYENSL